MSSRWSSGGSGSPRRAVPLAIGVAAVVLLIAGVGLALAVRSGGSGARPTTRKPASTATTTGSISLASGDDVVRGLPAPRAAGRLLVATAACRLEVIDVATRAISRPRPDVASCAATLLPAPGFAVASAGNADAQPVWRRIGLRPEEDRALLYTVPVTWAAGPQGDVATCQQQDGRTEVLVFSPSGRIRGFPGCSPAWWRGQLVRIDPAGRIVDERGAELLHPADAEAVVAGVSALAASRDGTHLALVHGSAPHLVVTVFDERGRAIAMLPVPEIGGRVASVLISNDGRLVAIQTNAHWTIWRTDGSVPPIDDVAESIIIDVALAPDSQSIATALAHRIVFLDPETLGPVAQLPVEADSLDWAP